MFEGLKNKDIVKTLVVPVKGFSYCCKASIHKVIVTYKDGTETTTPTCNNCQKIPPAPKSTLKKLRKIIRKGKLNEFVKNLLA